MAALPLVTGATGFAGGHLLAHLRETEPAVTAWAHAGGHAIPGDSSPGGEWMAVDLLDADATAEALATLRPSAIYHCAGAPHVARSWSDPGRALQINVLGTHHVLEGLRRAGHTCPVLITGSAQIYRPCDEALTEDHPIGPPNPYAVSKLAQEMLAARDGDIPVLLARPFNHAGPGQTADFVTSSFAKQLAEIEAGLSEPVLRVGNLEARRDVTDVRDTVRAYRLLVQRGRPARPYNVCTGTAHRIGDLLDTLIGLTRASVRREADPARMRPADMPLLLGDRRRIRAETGWEPRIPIEQTLCDLLDYWRLETSRRAHAHR